MTTSYRNGKKYVDGRVIEPTSHRNFPSSNSYTTYTATLWADGTASCNCPGWAKPAKIARRRCWHSDEMLGLRVNVEQRERVVEEQRVTRRIVL